MRRLSCTLVLLATWPAAAPLGAQEWRAGVQLGRISSDATPTASANSVALSLSRAGMSDWFGVTAGVPLDAQRFWGVAALWKRLQTGTQQGFGAELSAHGFVQRERSADGAALPLDPFQGESADVSGEGAGGEATAFAFVRAGALRLEASGGAAAQSSRIAGVAGSSLLPFAGARAVGGFSMTQLTAEARQWFGDSAQVFASVSAQLPAGPVDVWATAGQWLRGGVDSPELSVGASYAPLRQVRLEASYRSPAFDPLYGTATQRTFSLGASVRLGGASGIRAPVPAHYEHGRASIRIAASAVTGTPRIAGDFTNWQPRPMTRAGDTWTFTVPLEPGVYHYAFVNERDEWFVPAATPGRKDDGMGGHVAVLVVSE